MKLNGNDAYAAVRERMVSEQIEVRGVSNPAVLAAMRAIPRHAFVPEEERDKAYVDGPVGIGHGQTISQPYIVALMTELAQPTPPSRILEIGTGSGYQTAVLAACAGTVYTIELEPVLSEWAARTLAMLGFDNIHFRVGDGASGWPDEAPFDAIVVTAAPEETPQPLLDQLAVGGRLVIPVGESSQELYVYTRGALGFKKQSVLSVRFVPLRDRPVSR